MSTKLETFLLDFNEDPTATARFLVRTTENNERKVKNQEWQDCYLSCSFTGVQTTFNNCISNYKNEQIKTIRKKLYADAWKINKPNYNQWTSKIPKMHCLRVDYLKTWINLTIHKWKGVHTNITPILLSANTRREEEGSNNTTK